ncbi:MAG: DUF2752 domain-containing protein [Oscillospiraceae bacterium]|nr:DUF2752 domain-containing protein [Oscillospiraceae bacterium]
MKERVKKTAAVCLCIIAAGLAAAFLIKITGVGIPCAVYRTTGLKCPGCGNTTAVLALLELDFRKALEANLLMPVEFGYLLLTVTVTIKKYIKTGRTGVELPPQWVNIPTAVMLAVWTVYRNII